VYIVIENTPGYMPESEPAAFGNWRDAVSYAVALGREIRETLPGYRRLSVYRDDGAKCYCAEFGDPDDGWCLGRVVEALVAEEE
jgi:hypothetical protein